MAKVNKIVIKNVKTEWAKIAKPDESGNYVVNMICSPDQASELEAFMMSVWEEEMGGVKKPAWLGGKKELDEGWIRYVTKRVSKYKNKDGEEVAMKLVVLDRMAKEYDVVPSVANGAIMNISLNAVVTEYKKEKGISLYINSIQLVEFEPYGNDSDFEPLDKDESDFDAV